MTKFYHIDLWGSREDKYSFLDENDFTTIEWQEFFSNSPFYLFNPQNQDLLTEYNQGWQILDIFGFQSMGITSGDDEFLYDFSVQEVKSKIYDAVKEPININIRNERTLSRINTINSLDINKNCKLSLYRPFDKRGIFYCSQILERARENLAHQFLNANIGLITIRRTREGVNTQFFVTKLLVDKSVISSADNSNIFPLYLYPDKENAQGTLFIERTPNLSQKFLNAIKEKLGYIPAPETIFYYIYAIFHSPTYRQRYAEFLKIDFPRLPLTSNEKLWKNLAIKGEELVKLHLMESAKLNHLITQYQGEGENSVTEVTYKPQQQRVYINKTRYFQGINPEIWQFKIGGYQVLEKWLKDRKKANRSLSFDDILHYQKIVVALTETLKIMTEIDQIIPEWPIT